MAPTLTARHAPRYAALARLLLKHRGAALAVDGMDDIAGGQSADGGEEPERAGSGDEATPKDAKALVEELESMGPTFVKLGQLLSTRADLLPTVYLEALSRLRDDVEPLPPGEAERIIEEELSFRVSKGFASFDTVPMGSASLGQVHKATLRDGRPVAVKVQRPDIRKRVVDDMEVIAELAAWLDAHSARAERMGFPGMVEEFRRSIMGELDYRREAGNLRLLHEHLSDYRHLVVPLPVDDYCTSRVLTMELIAGRSVSSIGPLGRLDLNGTVLADELFRGYLDQVLVDGFFHADPHPGNVLLTDDGRLALIDAGMVARLAPEVREQLLRLLLAVSNGQGGETATALEELGDPLDDFDPARLRRQVTEIVIRAEGATMAQLDAGSLLGDLARASAESGLRPPVELTLLAKALLNLDEVARILDPDFEPGAVIRSHAVHVMRHRMLEGMSPAHLFAAALDAKDFAERLPGRMNKVLDALAEGKFTLNVEGVDEAELMRVGQKLANRVATGVVISALLLAAALFARTKTGVAVLGYPVLTVVLLVTAFVGTGWLMFGILRNDLPQRRRPTRD